MFLIVILRLFLVLKWVFQVIGILAPIFVFWEPQNKELIALITAIFLIIPEVIMATILWISHGVSLAYKTKSADPLCMTIPVFDEKSIHASYCGYLLILISFSILIGSFLEVPVLSAGISAIICFAWRRRLKQLFRKYLVIRV